jgi:lipoyl-dependent peroxiredoxin
MPQTKAEAVWQGSLKEGSGTMTLPKGGYQGPFTYASRFETGDGTNPEELIGAAHAGCFSMFLSAILSKDGHVPTRIHTTATVHLGDGVVSKIELSTKGEVPGIDQATFEDYAKKAKEGCPVSKTLAAVKDISVTAELSS